MGWFRPGNESSVWLYTSAAVVGLAGVFKLQQGGVGSSAVDSLFARTHCYQTVRTNTAAASAADETPNCFTVSPSGVFTRVFGDASAAARADPGHVIPGLWDGHGHLLSYGEFLNSVDLFGSASLGEVRARVDAYLDTHPGAGSKDEWVRGVGWDQMALGRMPTAVSGTW
jgi:predicted amidohydrolase YtcJ